MPTFDIQFAQARSRVTIEPGALGSLGQALASLAGTGKALVVSDETVADLYGDTVLQALRCSGFETDLIALPPGDATKSLVSADRIYDRAASFGLARDGIMVALGGGMVSDLAGFVAATWMRGVQFVICPTTVEADIDASIGGKTAVNHAAGKNLVGAFHQPSLVQIDPECLKTLDQRDVLAGLAESIKHAAIADESFLAWHEQHRDAILANDAAVMTELIEWNVRIKADVVTRDEREATPVRASLNFGHTIGHAIEAARGYELRHGECVALGMVAACRMCVTMGRLDERDCERVTRCINDFGLPTRLASPPPIDEILGYLGSDKKVAKGKVRFVLLDGLGRTELSDDVAEDVIREGYAAVTGQ